MVEVLDSDDECLEAKIIKAVTPLKPATNSNQYIKVEQGHKKVESSKSSDSLRSPVTVVVDGAVRGKDGRFTVTQKVKVNVIEKLTEVPACWPIPPAGTNTAYVIDLNDDKKW